MVEPEDTATVAWATDPVADARRRGDTLGRYVVLESIGHGGMGIVYRAYDPRLHREVALKQVRTGRRLEGEGEDQLVEEARAMARLSHPNVVAVYDVEATADGVVIVMEFVAGTTLRNWLEVGSRTWREVAAVMADAGRGLADAHAGGMVHGDFKPSNVVIGDDGRARVMDFGLARFAPRRAPADLTEAVTASGEWDRESSDASRDEIRGTPMYMSPEQLEGEPGDARADQYAYCVTYWQALAGRRPFEPPYAAMRLAKQEGPPPLPSEVGVPRRVQEAISRGLAPSPDDRFSSMDALLAELDAGARRSSSRWALAGGAMGIGVAAAIFLSSGSSDDCGRGQQRLAATWAPDRAAEVQSAFAATGLSYAAETSARVVERVDRFAGHWIDLHEEVCLANVTRGGPGTETMGPRMACLTRLRGDLDARVEVLLSPDRAVVDGAVKILETLPPVSSCASADALQTEVIPPGDPDLAEAVEDARRRLGVAASNLATGRTDAATAIIDELRPHVEQMQYGPLQAELELVVGEAHQEDGRYDAAEHAYRNAMQTAIEHRHWVVAARAASDAAHVVGHHQADPRRAGWLADTALSLAKLRVHAPLVEAGALNTIATLHLDSGDIDEAVALMEEVRKLRASVLDANHPLLAASDNNLGVAMLRGGEHERARVYLERALHSRIEALGEDHPRVGTTLTNLGVASRSLGRFEEAEAQYRRALEISRNARGEEHPDVASALNNLGGVALLRGRAKEAVETYRQALELRERLHGPDHPRLANTLNNLSSAHLLAGDYVDARPLAERSLALLERVRGPDHPAVTQPLRNLAKVDVHEGNPQAAITRLRRACQIFEARYGAADPRIASVARELAEAMHAADDRESLDWAERAYALHHASKPDPVQSAEYAFTLARATWLAGDEPKRAIQLAREARTQALEHGTDEDVSLEQIEAWLADRSAPQ